MTERQDAIVGLIGRFTADRDSLLIAVEELTTRVRELQQRLEALEARDRTPDAPDRAS